MSVAELFGWGSILVALLVAFVLGAAPVFAVRLIAAIYPKHHPRRKELIAESVHVNKGLLHIGEQWRWLGEMFALAVVEGVALRWTRFIGERPRLVWRSVLYYTEVEGKREYIPLIRAKKNHKMRNSKFVFKTSRQYRLVDLHILEVDKSYIFRKTLRTKNYRLVDRPVVAGDSFLVAPGRSRIRVPRNPPPFV